MPETADSPTVAFSLTCKRADEALEFYKAAFGAVEVFKMPMPDGNLAHCEFTIGSTLIFLSGEDDEHHAYAMPEGQMSSCLFSIVVDDCDAAHAQAVAAGAKSLEEPDDKFWGARSDVLLDPYGYRWSLIQITEQLTNEEVAARAAKLFGGDTIGEQ